jgi:uncharacterized repeat protein (TIGR03803 family)
MKKHANAWTIFARLDAGKEQHMRKLELGKIACIVAIFCVAAAVASPAQTFTTLVKFTGTPHPANPWQLVQGIDGNIYGITLAGGKNGGFFPSGGTFFRMTTAGKVTLLYSFCSLSNCADGATPNGLIQTADGKFYGTTRQGGASDATVCGDIDSLGCGIFFEIVPGHALTTLYSFCSQTNCNDGFYPFGAPLALGRNGKFYGTTRLGGNINGDNNCEWGCGTIFDITPTGTLTTLHVFCSTPTCPEGIGGGGLTLGTNGDFYGATQDNFAGQPGGGFYNMTPHGHLTVLYTFDQEANGDCCATAPIQATDGNFYGAAAGGKYGYGFIYKLTPGGNLSSLYDFCAQPSCPDGVGASQLIQGTDGNLYGTTSSGGSVTNSECNALGCGTVFQLTLTGKLTTLHSFCSEKDCADGNTPQGGPIQATNGIFYGPVTYGGSSSNCGSGGCGTIYSLSMGLSPFVEANPNFGRAGRTVVILGNHLTGTTKVTFNGTPATFTVVSSTELKTTVPTGATTGKIKVTTPERRLVSNVAFRVTK